MDDVNFSDYVMPGGGGKDAAGCREKSVFSVKSINVEQRRIEAVASREMVDRDGEIVSLSAMRAAIKEYMKNPVILSGHSHRLGDGRSPVVGKVVDYRFQGKDLLITVEFADTDLGLEYWKLYRDKYQRAFSIGFRGLQTREENIDGKRVRVFTDIELLEISCVAVPANPAALSKGKMTFAQRKAAAREKQRILDDVDALCRLFDRFDAARYAGKLLADGVTLDFSRLEGFRRRRLRF